MTQTKVEIRIFTLIDEDLSLAKTFCRKYRPRKISDAFIFRISKILDVSNFRQNLSENQKRQKFLLINAEIYKRHYNISHARVPS